MEHDCHSSAYEMVNHSRVCKSPEHVYETAKSKPQLKSSQPQSISNCNGVTLALVVAICFSIFMSLGSLCMGIFLLTSDSNSVTESQIAKALMDEQDLQVVLSSRIVELLNGTGEAITLFPNCWCFDVNALMDL